MSLYLFYPTLIVVASLFSLVVNRVNYDKIIIFFVFIIITIASGTRYGVGVDYVNYENIFYNINGYYESVTLDINNIYGLEPGYMQLNKFFGSAKWGFYCLIFFMSFVTMIFISAAISVIPGRYRYLAYFILITHAFIFLMQNQIRQAASIAIFIFSIRFINSGSKAKFFGVNILSAVLFHYSALIVLPMYLVRYFSLKKGWMILSLALVLPASIAGLFNSFLYEIVESISLYNAYLSTSFSNVNNLSIVNIITVVYFFILIYFFDRESNESKILFFGLILSCIFSNFSLLERLSSYFLYIKIISMPMMIYRMSNFNNKYIVLASLIVYSIAMYVNAMVINSGGNIPYINLIERFS